MSIGTAGVPKAQTTETEAKKREPFPINSELLQGVRISLEVRLGEAPMTVAEMLALKSGAVITLDTGLADHVELYLNDALVARGEVVAVGEKYGVRIIEIAQSS
jgi:flagellar motor switch protein FliN/FliY